MNKNDWIGLTASIGLHLLLLLGFTFITVGVSEPVPIGFIEVEFGPVEDGQPVRRAPEPSEAESPPAPAITQTETERDKPPAAEKVELPKAPEPPVEDSIDPEDEKPPTPDPGTSDETIAAQPVQSERTGERRSGSPEGSTGAESGAEGTATGEARTAPFQIEGLNRIPVTAPIPSYREKVNATIRVRITVDPRGRIVRTIPILKGNPSLEQSVMEALREWRFNALPVNAPQENQTGTVTFRFRLE